MAIDIQIQIQTQTKNETFYSITQVCKCDVTTVSTELTLGCHLHADLVFKQANSYTIFKFDVIVFFVFVCVSVCLSFSSFSLSFVEAWKVVAQLVRYAMWWFP